MTARLHLGCGDRRLPPPWINVDGRPGPAVDRVVDLHDPWPLETAAYEQVYASHVLEHLFPDKLPEILRHLHRVLAPGGRLTIATTDFELIYRNRFLDRLDGSDATYKEALFGEVGSRHHPMAAHRNVFTYEELGDLLVAAGFARVRPWAPEQYPEILSLGDFASTARSVSCYCEGVK